MVRRSVAPSVLLLLAGCGGAAAGMPGAGAPAEETEDVDQLLSRLADSERELQAQLGSETKTTSTAEPDVEEAPAGRAPAEAPPEDAPAKPDESVPAEPTSAPPPPSPCDVACRALGSMQRSAARICELTGDSDARCTGALDRVTRAEQRVARAGCDCEG